jgi:hypothetical protein
MPLLSRPEYHPSSWPPAFAKPVADTAYLAPIGYVVDGTGFLKDAASDVVGALKNAVDKLIDDTEEASPGAWLKARLAEVAR